MDPVKVSVVIPTRNRADRLPRCLDSILAQKIPVNEIIVIDDHSDDNTEAVIGAYACRGVKYRRLTRGNGAQAARNEGWQVAENRWIAFQDSDDEWLPEKMEKQLGALGEYDFVEDVVLHCNGLKVFEATGQITPIDVPLTQGYCFEDLLLRPAPMFPSLLVSKKALEEAGGLDENCPSYQEWETSLRLARKCRFVHLQERFFKWNWHSGETISKDKKREIIGYDYVLDRYKSDIIEHFGERVWRQIKVQRILVASREGFCDYALDLIRGEDDHHTLRIAEWLVKRKITPRGISRLLRLIA
jgi:glycosyltransferase involved in cell wall biosynthesis